MRIHLLGAALAATLLLSAGCGSDTSTGNNGGNNGGTPARVDLVSAPPATGAAGANAGAFSVKVVDASGAAVSAATVTFTAVGAATLAPSTVTTDASGVATTQVTLGTSAGTVTLRANVAGVASAITSSITILAGPAAKLVVTPKSLRFSAVGDTVRITSVAQDQYGNTAGSSTVSYVSLDPTLITVDASGLARAVRQGGSTLIIATSGTGADTTSALVLAPGQSVCTGLLTSTPMNVGDVQAISGAQYGCFNGSTSGAEYAIVAFNSLADQVNSINVSMTAQGAATPPSFALSPSGTGVLSAYRAATGNAAAAVPELDEQFHQQLTRAASQQFRGGFARARTGMAAKASVSSTNIGGFNVQSQRSAIPANAKVGDIVTMNVSAGICSGAVNHGMRVAAVGDKSIVLADTLNPTGGFTDTDYARFAARFDTLVYPLDVGAFGPPTDIDNNGKVAILFTRTVNELVNSSSGYYVGGFFNPRDLFPRKGQTAADDCPGSNEGEMFYMLVPAPAGINGVVHTTGFVDSITTGIIAHEFQHLISGGYRIYGPGNAQDFEEVWLGEGLSHIAEELLYYRESGMTPRMNLNDSTIRILNRPTYPFWKNDAAQNFSRFLQYVRDPGGNTPIADNDELPTRGATWSFLRYTADRLAPTDGTIWQRMVQSDKQGLATIQQALGFDPQPWFRDWAVANYTDDFGITVDPKYTHPSWNFRNIYTNTFLNITQYPLRVTGLTNYVKTDFSIRGYSASYARLAVPANADALVTFSSGGGLPSNALQFMVVRTK